MKATNERSFRCPKCGNMIKYTYWAFVDSDLNIEETEALQSGSFFSHRCPQCGSNVNLFHSMDFIDPNTKTIVSYIQTKAVQGHEEKYRGTVKEIPSDSDKDGFRTRIVFTPEDFFSNVRKVSLSVKNVRGLRLSQ